jgi:hypothetical protein
MMAVFIYGLDNTALYHPLFNINPHLMNLLGIKEIIGTKITELGSINLRKADSDFDPGVRRSESFQHVMKLIRFFTTLPKKSELLMKWSVDYATKHMHIMQEWETERDGSTMVGIRFKQSVQEFLTNHVPEARDMMLEYSYNSCVTLDEFGTVRVGCNGWPYVS